jgi:acyl-CoA synthetase (AMP-forming)/AMP-acid ligase II
VCANNLQVPGSVISTDQLRQALEAKLPHYMVPRAIIILDEFPLTPNGKVDKKVSLAGVRATLEWG